MSGTLRYSHDDAVSAALAAADPAIGRVIRRVGSVEIPSPRSRFAALARIVVGQQLSEASADAIAARVERTVGLTPKAMATASDAAFRAAGVSARKTAYLRDVARAVLSGELDLDALDGLDDEAVIERLTRIRGIGAWTAQTFLLLALRRPDVVVSDDVGIRTAAGRMLGLGRAATPDELAAASERWRPHRSAATLYLYADRT